VVYGASHRAGQLGEIGAPRPFDKTRLNLTAFAGKGCRIWRMGPV
jgi:hypothetical protein